MTGFNIQELMSQAKKQYEVLQKKMQETVVEASSGGGAVTVKMDGRKQARYQDRPRGGEVRRHRNVARPHRRGHQRRRQESG
jgi:hypothetical protein